MTRSPSDINRHSDCYQCCSARITKVYGVLKQQQHYWMRKCSEELLRCFHYWNRLWQYSWRTITLSINCWSSMKCIKLQEVRYLKNLLYVQKTYVCSNQICVAWRSHRCWSIFKLWIRVGAHWNEENVYRPCCGFPDDNRGGGVVAGEVAYTNQDLVGAGEDLTTNYDSSYDRIAYVSDGKTHTISGYNTIT